MSKSIFNSNIFTGILLASLNVSSVCGYEEVKVEKIITIPDKKMVPSVLRLDKEGQIWVLSASEKNIARLSSQGTVTYNMPAGKKGLFKSVIDFDFFNDSSMIVVDDSMGKALIISGEKESSTSDAKMDWSKNRVITQFPVEAATSVAVSRDDIIAIGYKNQPGVDLFSSDGILLHKVLIPEKYDAKNIGAVAFSNDGILWALETDKGQLHRFSPERKWLGVTEALENAQRVVVDKFGYVYVTLGKGRWKEITPEGAVTGTFGTKGKNPGEMLSPVGIGLPDPFHVLVAESGNKRLQLFNLTNKDKKTELPPKPAAFIQVRLQSMWEDKASAALMTGSETILLIRPGKGFEWVDLEGNVKSTFKKKTKGVPSLIDPTFFTIDPTGQIWVSDQGDHTIKAVSETGEIIKTFGQKGSKEGNIKDPSFLQVRKDGSFVIVDKGNSRIQVLSPSGLFLFTVGSEGKKEGQFLNVAGLAVNDDIIAVLDDKKKALIYYSSTGKFLFEVANKEGKAPYWTEPVSLSADNEGRFFLLDRGFKRVRIFNSKGQFAADFSADGYFIGCGPQQKIIVLSEKTVALFSAHLVPKEVQNLSAVDDVGNIKLTWDLTSDAVHYDVYRSSNSNPFVLLVKNTNPPIVDSVLTPSQTYTYAVAGVNGIGYEGAWSLSKPLKASKRKDVSLLNIEKAELKPVFTAAFKYYVDKPIGEIQIKNNDEIAHRNIKIALSLSRYTDFPTENIVPVIEAGQTLTVPVTLTFNDRVLELTEDTPVQMDVRVSYFEDNEEKKVSLNTPIVLYSRNAISWGDKARISSFITPRDTPVVEFAREGIRAFLAPLKGSTVGKPLAKAALFYEALNALRISYVPDPKTPFSDVSGKPEALDYVQFPRETLRRKTGDCDDMTSLMASLLESIGVQTALIDMPGHIFLMANMEEGAPEIIGLPIDRFVEFEGTYWVPIEMTQLGKNFLSAWQAASTQLKTAKEKGSIEFIPTAKSFEKYPPVTLVEADPDRPPFPEELVKQTFPVILDQLQNERYNGLLEKINDEIKADPVNHMLEIQLGMIHVEGKKIEEAKKIFNKLISADEPVEVQAAAQNNLGNLAYLAGNFEEAAKFYATAAQLSQADGCILVNQARTAWKMGDNKTAKSFIADAKAKSKDWREYASDIPAEIIAD